jgi:hypothetical protein
MTDPLDMAALHASIARHKSAVTKANDLNKTVLFDVLSQFGVTKVIVDFDGEGDSGQIEDVTAFIGDVLFELPGNTITIHDTQWGSDMLTTSLVPITEAIEGICYGYLEQEHAGWENNEGAYGEFTIDVAARKIELDCNIRFSSSENYKYEF